MLGFILSTIAFFIASHAINRYLDEQSMDKGRKRTILVVLLASLISIGVSSATDWVGARISGEKPADPLQDATQLLKVFGH